MTLVLLLRTPEDLAGPYVVSFDALQPRPRHDGAAWTKVTIEEASLLEGPYTELITADVTPVDTDPATPESRAITVIGATLPSGWYRITFGNTFGDLETHGPLRGGADPGIGDTDSASLVPLLADIGALLHARTASGGTEVGTFDETTIPTGDQVTALITVAVADVRARVGTAITPDYAAEARRLASLQAASLVEASFFPNQLDSDRSAYRQYQAMYLTGVENLSMQVNRPAALRLP